MAEQPSTTALVPPETFLTLLEEARAGSTAALGVLVEECRHYMLSVANQELPANLRAKVAPSDVVQDSCLEAQLGFEQFRGDSREELVNWLRAILLFNIHNARRRYCETGKRQLHLELSLNESMENSGAPWQFVAEVPTPSQVAMKHEDEARIERAIEQLPDLLRQAVVLRQREHLTFAEVGHQMNRSGDAARKLWARGIEQLHQLLANEAE